MTGMPVRLILRAEQIALLVAGVWLWLANGGPPVLLVPALLAPDLSMVGYLRGPRLGSITYNAAHNLVLAVGLLGIGWGSGIEWLLLAGAAVTAHVGWIVRSATA
jgi:Domain of unknown function (DUF4260)